MKRQLALFGICLTLAACADDGQQAKPMFSLNNEKLQPVSANPYQQGKYDLVSGQYGHAIQQFTALLRRDPYNVDALNALGITYDCLGRHDLARRYLERALALDPSSPVTLNNLGRSWMNDGNWSRAVGYLQQAQALDGTDRQITSNLEMARSKVEAAQMSPALVASGDGQDLWIDRATPFIQVLHTHLDRPPAVRGETDRPRRQSAARLLSIAVASLQSTTDHVKQTATLPGMSSARKTKAAPGTTAVVGATGRRDLVACVANHSAGPDILPDLFGSVNYCTSPEAVVLSCLAHRPGASALNEVVSAPERPICRNVAGTDLNLVLGSDRLHFGDRMLAASGLTKGLIR
jgi:Tfp pilus assembly protein PilF